MASGLTDFKIKESYLRDVVKYVVYIIGLVIATYINMINVQNSNAVSVTQIKGEIANLHTEINALKDTKNIEHINLERKDREIYDAVQEIEKQLRRARIR